MSQRLPSSDNVVLKGIREEPSAEDGARVLVDRLWPRGVSKERAALDEWAKGATPTTELRRAFHSGDLPWPQFVEAYRAELTDLMAHASRQGYEMAIHAIGDAAVDDVAAAFAHSGAAGRLEHAQLLPADALELPVQIRHALDEVTSVQLGYPERF